MNRDNDSREIPWRLLILIVLLVFLTVLGINYLWLESDPQKGDMFGFANAVFSGLAFAGVVCTVLIQGQELKLQRKELSLNREELARQREQMESQASALQQQAFENTFFQLLTLQSEITNSIDLKNGTNITKGRDCFVTFYRRFRQSLNPKNSNETEKERIINSYLRFYGSHGHEIGHYFRNLYNTVKFVDRSYVNDKKVYTNIIRAQLSNFELALLFYNCLSPLGNEKFKPLVEKYALLKTLDFKLLDQSEHPILYDPSAFGK